MAERGERVRANRGKGSERWPRRVCVRGARSPALQQESAGRSRTRARERSRSWCADDSAAVQTVFRPASWRTRSGRAWRAWLVEGGGCDGVCAEAQSVPNERCAESGSRRDGRSEDEEELPVEGEDEGQLLEAAQERVAGASSTHLPGYNEGRVTCEGTKWRANQGEARRSFSRRSRSSQRSPHPSSSRPRPLLAPRPSLSQPNPSRRSTCELHHSTRRPDPPLAPPQEPRPAPPAPPADPRLLPSPCRPTTLRTSPPVGPLDVLPNEPPFERSRAGLAAPSRRGAAVARGSSSADQPRSSCPARARHSRRGRSAAGDAGTVQQ